MHKTLHDQRKGRDVVAALFTTFNPVVNAWIVFSYEGERTAKEWRPRQHSSHETRELARSALGSLVSAKVKAGWDDPDRPGYYDRKDSKPCSVFVASNPYFEAEVDRMGLFCCDAKGYSGRLTVGWEYIELDRRQEGDMTILVVMGDDGERVEASSARFMAAGQYIQRLPPDKAKTMLRELFPHIADMMARTAS